MPEIKIKPMKASDLIARLQMLIEEYGDCTVFSEADWEVVQEVEFCPMGERVAIDEPYFILAY